MERVDLAHQDGVDRRRRWLTGKAYWQERRVTFGRLADGRWFAEDSKDPGGAFVFDGDAGERLALRYAYRLMEASGASWRPIPAAYDGRGNPADGLPWVASGHSWKLAE